MAKLTKKVRRRRFWYYFSVGLLFSVAPTVAPILFFVKKRKKRYSKP